jgi:hypothetical protein
MWKFSPYAPLLYLSSFGVEYSGSLVETVPDDQIRGDSINHVPVGLAYQTQMFGVPPKLGMVVSHKDIAGTSWAFPTFGLAGMVEVDMYENMKIEVGMAWVDIGMDVAMLVFMALIGQCLRSIYSALLDKKVQLCSLASLGQASEVAFLADHGDRPSC